jgi:phage repressor protein C with HTH and peptisase S24 domain
MSYDEKRVRAALAAFQKSSGLRDYPWETASGVGPGTLRSFRSGRNRAMSNATYEKLASGATALLNRDVTAAELRADPGMSRQIRVASFVGAGDEIVPIPTDEPIDWALAPPGMDNVEATEVRGRSMMPFYHHGDLLFHRRIDKDPGRFKDEALVVQVTDGKRMIKLLQPGARRGRFNLISINPSLAPLENQAVDWVGPIEWVNKRRPR